MGKSVGQRLSKRTSTFKANVSAHGGHVSYSLASCHGFNEERKETHLAFLSGGAQSKLFATGCQLKKNKSG